MNTAIPLQHDVALLYAEAKARGLPAPRPDVTLDEAVLIEWAKTLDLGLERTMVLLLKARWETMVGTENVGREPDGAGEEGAERVFDPDPAGMLAKLESHGVWSPESGVPRDMVRDWIREAVLNRMYRVSIRSPECDRFVADARTEAEIFASAEPTLRERLSEARGHWILRCSVHADLLAALVNQQLANARINQQFMVVFGKPYLELEETIRRGDGLRTRIRLNKADPALTREGLDEHMRESEARAQRALEELRALAIVLPAMPPMGAAGAAPIEAYRHEVKTALRRLWRLLHPDTLGRKEGYQKLSRRQRDRLDEIWNALMKVRPAELAFGPDQVGYRERSLDRILQAEREARAILEDIPGLDLDAKYQVQGATAEDRLQWYETESRAIDEDIAQTRAQLAARVDDPDVRERRALLEVAGARQEDIRTQMRAQLERQRTVAETLEKELDRLFTRGARQ